MFEEASVIYKIKIVFPLPEIKGKSPPEALAFVAPMIGAPKYVEEFQGKIEHFHFRIPGPEGFKTEARTWALEKTSPDGEWGLAYRFTHDLAGVNFAIPVEEILVKTVEGNFLLRKGRKLPPRFPVLLAYPLPEMDDEPTLSELKVWREDRENISPRKLLTQIRSLFSSQISDGIGGR